MLFFCGDFLDGTLISMLSLRLLLLVPLLAPGLWKDFLRCFVTLDVLFWGAMARLSDFLERDLWLVKPWGY